MPIEKPSFEIPDEQLISLYQKPEGRKALAHLVSSERKLKSIWSDNLGNLVRMMWGYVVLGVVFSLIAVRLFFVE